MGSQVNGVRSEWRKDKPRAYLNQLVTVAIQDQKSAFSALFLGVTVLADLLLREAPGLGQQRIVLEPTLQRPRKRGQAQLRIQKCLTNTQRASARHHGSI